MQKKLSDNLVKEHLEELKVISSEQFIDYVMIDGDKWEMYRTSDDTIVYIRFELTGKIGYAFCARITCKKMHSSFKAFYHVKSYGNETKNEWECEQSTKDSLMCNAIAILKPY